MKITRKQFELLKAFFAHCFNVYHNDYEAVFSLGFWAEQLVKAGIPWSVQNIVAEAAETKSNNDVYFSNLLVRLEVEVLASA